MDIDRLEEERDRYDTVMAAASNVKNNLGGAGGEGEEDENCDRNVNYRLCTIEEVPAWIKEKVIER